MSAIDEAIAQVAEGAVEPEIDSKYRLIIVAAKRSKQLQRGAKPRIDIDSQKHKPTRVALEEVIRGRVPFRIKIDGHEPMEG
ncbi:MAG TPA: DNA-directed RNA polymerase subunit omega [Pyrinomonadaceae bacterium]|nr:DNA-directed RNA polymerase subunit omega [Pyrinomonadaceae bacterium]